MAQDEEFRGTSTAADIEMTETNDQKLVKHLTDADEAMKAFAELGEEIELDEATNRRLVRTIDCHIMPIMCLVYAMNFLDSMRCGEDTLFQADPTQKLPCLMPASWVSRKISI
jgi:ACS family allantoate permease-like MFS transporter